MNYNYFVDYKIVTTEQEVNTEYNHTFVPFTQEQNEFYAEHPDATYWEVVKCQMDPEPEPPTPPSLDEVKKEAISFLSEKSLATLGRYVKEYQLANAQSSLYMLDKYPEYSPIYTREKAVEVITTYDRVGLDLRTIYKNAETDINGCETVEEVATFRAYYENQYDNYVYNPNIEE